MAKACNKILAISDDDGECQRSEIKRMRRTSDEITTAAVSSTTAVSPTTTVSSFTALSSTTLQDLPIEVLDYILMKAVVKKVMNKKLAKCSWISCASRVIEPMRTVWSQWNYCLTKRWFKIMLSRTLKSKDRTTISVKTVCAGRHEVIRIGLAKLGNKIYCLDGRCEGINWSPKGLGNDYGLFVYDAQDMNRRTEVISLPLIVRADGIVACKRSNSLYVWQCGGAVWRLIPDGNGGCKVLNLDYLATGDFVDFCIRKLSVLDDGNLLVMRGLYKNDEQVNILSVQNPDGLVIRNIKLSPNKYLPNVSVKSNGNFLYAELVGDGTGQLIFREIDQNGNEIRNVHWLHDHRFCVDRMDLFLDSNDTVILLNDAYHLIFMDAELNFLENVQFVTPKHTLWGDFGIDERVSYSEFDKETNEMIIMYQDNKIVVLQLTL